MFLLPAQTETCKEDQSLPTVDVDALQEQAERIFNSLQTLDVLGRRVWRYRTIGSCTREVVGVWNRMGTFLSLVRLDALPRGTITTGSADLPTSHPEAEQDAPGPDARHGNTSCGKQGHAVAN